MSRHSKRKAIMSEITDKGLRELIDVNSWNHPLRKTEIILRKLPRYVYIAEAINKKPVDRKLAARWEKVLKIMEKHSPSEDTKTALRLYDKHDTR